LNHADTYVVKLPIAFPCLLTELILSQHPDILKEQEHQVPSGPPLTVSYRLFTGTHVQDIVLPPGKSKADAASTSQDIGSSTDVLTKLKAVSATLQETIDACTARKANVDALIKSLTTTPAATNEEELVADDEESENEEDRQGDTEKEEESAGEDSEEESNEDTGSTSD
jgi:hypothetical protein